MKEKLTPCGEQEENYSAYTKPDPKDTHYSEKHGHKERTLGNDTRKNGHAKHWKKNGS